MQVDDIPITNYYTIITTVMLTICMLAQSPAAVRREDDPATPENLREMRKILPGAYNSIKYISIKFVVAVYFAGSGSFSKYSILTYKYTTHKHTYIHT